MNKRFLISWVVAFVVWMVGDFLLHGLILGETYAGLTNKDVGTVIELLLKLIQFMIGCCGGGQHIRTNGGVTLQH